ncbi:MAG TPA: hypothetical protein VK966_07535 [Longimicrobiales bacterium]|nr:hypothetical protein [Longimicrobiales bacterium]
MTEEDEGARRRREKEWSERLLLWIVLGVVVTTLALAFLFQVLA